MTEKAWLGGMFVKSEGGYHIIFKALQHYKKRLQHIGSSPEVKDAGAMFGQILEQEGMKAMPKIENSLKHIQEALIGSTPLLQLTDDLDILVKALECYKADIKKAQDDDKYYSELIGKERLEECKKDIPIIDEAISKLKKFE